MPFLYINANERNRPHQCAMTIQQLHWFNGLYLAVLVAVAIATRATSRRVVGALAGGATGATIALCMIALGETAGWWRFAIHWEPYYLTLLWIDFALGAFIFLIAWRIARRFGWYGLVVALAIAVILGPVRDRQYIERYPEWGAYAPGIVPGLAIAATYFLMGVFGYAAMRCVAGPAASSPLARRWWRKTSHVESEVTASQP